MIKDYKVVSRSFATGSIVWNVVVIIGFALLGEMGVVWADSFSVEQEILDQYLMPDDHPAKEELDQIFLTEGILHSQQRMKEAGFIDPQPKLFSHLVITTHPAIPGYIIKTFLEESKQASATQLWVKRIEGAESLRHLIDQKRWHRLFKVPHKWIYLLPGGGHSLLVAEDMQLVLQEENWKFWFKKTSKDLLDKLLFLLEKLGLQDSTTPDNIALSVDGRIAFVDTACHHRWPVAYHKLNPFLSPSKQKYWKRVTKQR